MSDKRPLQKPQRDAVTRIHTWKEDDYYEILGVKPDASLDEIRTQGKKLLMLTHSDKNPDKDADAALTRVKNASDVLSDPNKRREYDEKRRKTGAPKQGDLGESFAPGAWGSEDADDSDDESKMSDKMQDIINKARAAVEGLLDGNEELAKECNQINESIYRQNIADDVFFSKYLLPTNFLLKTSRERQKLVTTIGSDKDPDKQKDARKELETLKEKVRNHLCQCELPMTWTFTIPQSPSQPKKNSSSKSHASSKKKTDSTRDPDAMDIDEPKSNSQLGDLITWKKIIGHRSRVVSSARLENGQPVAVEIPTEFIVEQTDGLNSIAIAHPSTITRDAIDEYMTSEKKERINGIEKSYNEDDACTFQKVLGIARKFARDNPDHLRFMVIQVQRTNGEKVLLNKTAFIKVKSRSEGEDAIDNYLESIGEAPKPRMKSIGYDERLHKLEMEVFDKDDPSDCDSINQTSNYVDSHRRRRRRKNRAKHNDRYASRSIAEPNYSSDEDDFNSRLAKLELLLPK
ncbi:DnaJ-domain-containing protein [Aaosphaeria arxii CBS 175.79]|uniref:DnaJ-domain-containing protein n=1 Tax=Aaosphaeria arxii CBS 175.79 TaxID=1450172 RepID=A0A6A5X5Z0_9PLEO|nr:DnaJ-domain-containing protein [Aaosphaeria arxii CBS 175.79]KAF2008332.1 DnaJ-domain-containing protein [Aaosphaeria arxii CBS 175.79]